MEQDGEIKFVDSERLFSGKRRGKFRNEFLNYNTFYSIFKLYFLLLKMVRHLKKIVANFIVKKKKKR